MANPLGRGRGTGGSDGQQAKQCWVFAQCLCFLKAYIADEFTPIGKTPALQGSCLSSCVVYVTTDIKTHRQVCHVRHVGPRTQSRTTDENLDCAVFEKRLFSLFQIFCEPLAPPFATPLGVGDNEPA